MKNIRIFFFLKIFFFFFVENISVYLNRHVFVMDDLTARILCMFEGTFLLDAAQ